MIKQFQFATGAGWDGYRAIEREIQGLNHRGIPKYLDKFETANGYCLVTEYFPADTLAVARSFTPDQIKQIAIQLLEILVYLQERMPPVIHRDVKPENILVDNNLNVYLIDFGFARVGSGSAIAYPCKVGDADSAFLSIGYEICKKASGQKRIASATIVDTDLMIAFMLLFA